MASASGQAAATRSVEVPRERVSVALEPAATLRIVVPELAAANAAAQARLTKPGGTHLTLPLPGGRLQSTWPLVRGEALLAGLPAGAWAVEIHSADGRVWRQAVNTAPGVLNEVIVN